MKQEFIQEKPKTKTWRELIDEKNIDGLRTLDFSKLNEEEIDNCLGKAFEIAGELKANAVMVGIFNSFNFKVLLEAGVLELISRKKEVDELGQKDLTFIVKSLVNFLRQIMIVGDDGNVRVGFKDMRTGAASVDFQKIDLKK